MFLLIVVAAIILRIYLITRDSVPFAYDMGRDLLWAKDIAFYGIPTLIGPQGSIWGVYFGPFWYYFLSIPLLLTGGHPLSAVYATASVIILAGFLAYILFKPYFPKIYALTLAIVILFSSTLINISTFAFHANVLPFLSLLMIYFCFLSVIKNPLFISLALFSTSLMFHADPAPAVVFLLIPPFIFIFFKLYKAKDLLKLTALSFLAFFLPFIPQVIFELRNNFIETRSLISYFAGENPSLSGQLPFFQRIMDRSSLFFTFFKVSFTPNNNFFATLFLILIVFGIYKFLKNTKDKNLLALFKISALGFVLTYLIFTLVITVEIKNWYLYGVTILFALLIVFAIYGLRNYRKIVSLFIIIYLVLNTLPFLRNEKKLKSKTDPATLSNQLAAIDSIYNDAKDLSFSVYTFTPSIYDLNYQYLFWWRAVKSKRGLPQDFTYLPDQPSYVRNKNVYATETKTTNTVYLIIENAPENEFYTSKNWLINFKDYQIVWQKDINGAIKLEKRVK